MYWTHAPDLGWGRRPKLHGMQGVGQSAQPTGIGRTYDAQGPYRACNKKR
jgi:hypothetical protein